jgi:DNA-binding NtrC family response regulator
VKNPTNPTIHIIDNNSGYRKILDACFKALKYTNLRTFETCEACLESNEKPDIIILDHAMKEYHISGLDFLIRYKHQFSNTHFLFFSSDASVDVAVRSIKWGACDYFIKSKKGMEQLILRFNNLIQSYRAMRRKQLVYNASILSLGMFSLVFVLAILLYNML